MVLILDAWEKTVALKAEYHVLRSFLDHMDDWPNLHILMGVRCPELDNEGRDKAHEYIRDLRNSQPVVTNIYDLPPMDFTEPTEMNRLRNWTQTHFPRELKWNPERWLKWIDGFPGVLENWDTASKREEIHKEADLKGLADDAQRYRHREFEKLLARLSGDQRRLAMRLAIFPRLDRESWPKFRSIILGELDESVWRNLLRIHVLEDPDGQTVPSYGHDTRHAAAFRWFYDQAEYRPDLACEGSGLTVRLGAAWQSVTDRDRPYAEALRVLRRTMAGLPVGDTCLSIIEAAEALFEGGADRVDWGLFEAGREQAATADRRLTPILCSALIARANSKSAAGDTLGEISDYSAVIAMPDAPADQKAKALLYRGVMYSQRGEKGDWQLAVDDYSAVIAMPDAPADQKAKAQANWGVELCGQANTEEGEKRVGLLRDALGHLLEGEGICPGSCPVNTACVCALLGDTTACRHWLDTARSHEKLTPKLLDDKDFDSVRSLAWFKELRDWEQ